MSLDQILMLPPGYGFDSSNASPTITVPGAQSATSNVALAITGTSIADTDSNPQTVTLSVSHGTFSLAGTTGLSFTVGDGTADATMTFSGSVANINTAIATLTYTSTTDYAGADSLAISTNDGAGGTDSDSVAITVTWTPISLGSKLVAWFSPDPADGGVFEDAGTDAAEVTDPVYRWKTTNAATYVEQATLANRPILRQGANGKYYLEFDGVNDFLSITGLSNIDCTNFFAAGNVKLDVVGNNDFAWGHSGDYTGSGFFAIIDMYWMDPPEAVRSRFSDNDQSPVSSATFTNAVNTSWQRLSQQFDGTTNTLYENNVSKATNTPAALSTANITRLCFGSGITDTAGSNANCNIGNYILCTNDLTSDERVLVETFLASKEPT